MLFPQCYTEAAQSLFLQRRAPKSQNSQSRKFLSPNSKISLKTIKSSNSQKSISTKDELRPFESVSLKSIKEHHKSSTQIFCFDQDFNLRKAVPEKQKFIVGNHEGFKLQRRNSDIIDAQVPKITIFYEKTDRVVNALTSAPKLPNTPSTLKKSQSMISLKISQCPQKSIQPKQIEEITQQPQDSTITLSQIINSSFQTLQSGEEEPLKESDMKSTHIGSGVPQFQLLINNVHSKPKSVVSMLSDRSPCDSIIVDRQVFKPSAKLIKLL